MTSVGRAYSHYYNQLEREEAKRKGIEWPPRDEYDHLLNLVLLGDSGVGKAHFCHKFCHDHFDSRYPSHPSTLSIADCDVRKVYVDDNLVKILVWDTHGREIYSYSADFQLRRANGVIIMYDVTNRESYNNTETWLEYANEKAAANTVKFLVGNKVDLSRTRRKVEVDTAIDFAVRHELLFYETSCKDGTNVEFAIMTMVAKIMEGVDLEKTRKQKQKAASSSDDSRSCCVA